MASFFGLLKGEMLNGNAGVHSLKKSNLSILDSILLCLLGCAIFFPSSLGGDFNKLALERFVFLMSVLVLFGFRFFRLSGVAFLLFSSIAIFYLMFSIIYEGSDYAFGHALSLLPVMTLLLLRPYRSVSLSLVLSLYYVTVILVFVVGYVGFVFSEVAFLQTSLYSGGYSGLSERFLGSFVPVSIFTSHSYAGFFYFIFVFVSSLLFYHGYSRLFNLLVVLVSLTSLLALKSGSSYFFFIYSCIFLVYFIVFLAPNRYTLIFLKIFLLACLVFVLVFFYLHYASGFISRIIGDSGNGLLSRYGGGVLKPSLDYIYERPLVGIGFGYSESFYYTDSDYVVVALRLGIMGASLYFLYFFLFLYSSMRAFLGASCFCFLVGAVSAFMISMPVSTYYRTVPVLLLLVLLFEAINKNARIGHVKR
ncbi:hypothetical protein [Marinobacter nauticus]|uniref:hypothetical protein n=1 Tax=Marinobacter nauticus TaxID=2743 RepID=UPI001CD7FEF5|nr:hypothetical protein [Marinobacter nauticus]MCA0912793.1 hypothetical protein [Marinobacter nauticus]